MTGYYFKLWSFYISVEIKANVFKKHKNNKIKKIQAINPDKINKNIKIFSGYTQLTLNSTLYF